MKECWIDCGKEGAFRVSRLDSPAERAKVAMGGKSIKSVCARGGKGEGIGARQAGKRSASGRAAAARLH